MARPTKPGLDYFPLNVNFSEDEKIEIIEAEFGYLGFYVIIKLFMRIYGMNGYYMMFTLREQKLFSKRINVDINSVIAIINSAINEKIFDKYMYEKYGILTSKGIQTRYLEAVERRTKIELINEFLLIDVPKAKNISLISMKNVNELVFANNNSINVYNNSINDDIMYAKSTQSKVKESKVKESKEDETCAVNFSSDENVDESNCTVNDSSTENDKTFEDDSCTASGFQQSDGCADEIVKFYKEKIGEDITSGVYELLNSYRTNFTDDVIIYALELSVEKKANSIHDYAKAILNNWIKEGIKTLEQAKTENKKRASEEVNTKKTIQRYEDKTTGQYNNLDRFYVNLS